MIYKKIFFLILAVLVINHLSHAQVALAKFDSSWRFIIGNQPFYAKGVTFGFDQEVEKYDSLFQDLNEIGVNTIRTWGTNENTMKLLDAAEKYGIKIMLGIWMRHSSPGMEDDDRFDYLNDEPGKKQMYDDALKVARQFKDHPALLSWGIGNEVFLHMKTDQERIAYSKLLEKVCSAVKELDPNHPITSVEAWTFGVKWWKEYVPSIDIYGINTYGGGANYIPDELAKLGVAKPYIITEFGVRGEWEMEIDKNGVNLEPSDQEKYDAIVTGFADWIEPKPNCLGVYVFHYSNADGFLSPYFQTHFQGYKRPQYWAIRKAFTGKDAENEVPIITNLSLPDTDNKPGNWVPISIEANDPEGDSLAFSFYYNQRNGSRKLREQLIKLPSKGNLSAGFEIEVPKESGAIKIYAMASDTYGNMGVTTSSMKIDSEPRAFQVPYAQLPFYVYQDSENLPYIPSAYMGNQHDLRVDFKHRDDVHSGQTAIKITFNSETDWYGLGFVDPPNDWGEMLGGYDISGAETFSFWAKSNINGLEITAGFGLIENDMPFPDTGIRIDKIYLTREWKKYTMKIGHLDLRCIRTGFVIYSYGQGGGHVIYLDDIVFE